MMPNDLILLTGNNSLTLPGLFAAQSFNRQENGVAEASTQLPERPQLRQVILESASAINRGQTDLPEPYSARQDSTCPGLRPLAGFEVITSGRFAVITEDSTSSGRIPPAPLWVFFAASFPPEPVCCFGLQPFESLVLLGYLR
jgi:hypothetical protein